MHNSILLRAQGIAHAIRLDALEMVHLRHASHIASVFSVADIIATLYAGAARTFPENPRHPDRDRIVLSKGHAGVAIYAALAETGFINRDELIRTFYTDGSVYSGHVSHKGVPGVEISTGSLGQGVCTACGMALAGRINGKGFHVFAIAGDGECEEGAVWECALFAAHRRLDNFTLIVDNNGMQAMGNCKEEAGLDDLESKFSAFGWHVVSVPDGNDVAQLIDALGKREPGKPTAVIAHTIKGKGVSFMENNLLWHYRDPQDEWYEQAKRELTEVNHA